MGKPKKTGDEPVIIRIISDNVRFAIREKIDGTKYGPEYYIAEAELTEFSKEPKNKNLVFTVGNENEITYKDGKNWKKGKISSNDQYSRERIDNAQELDLAKVSVSNVNVKKLIVHTNITQPFFSAQSARNILIKSSVYTADMRVFYWGNQTQGLVWKEEKEVEFTGIEIDKNNLYWNITCNTGMNKSTEEKRIYDEADIKQISDAVNDACSKIKKSRLMASELSYKDGTEDEDKYPFSLVSFSDYRPNKEEDKKAIVYSIEKNGEDYFINTGLFCGVVNTGTEKKNPPKEKKNPPKEKKISPIPPIEIRTEYSDTLVMRMINRCCGIFADRREADSEVISDSIYSKIVQLMYILSLRKIISIMAPKKYEHLRNRGYNIRGNVDINAYISKDIISKDKKVSYIYPERREIQNVIDVLYAALKACKKTTISGSLPDIKNYEQYLAGIYSGRRPSISIIRNIHKEKCLQNSLYSAFKRPLSLARMLLENEELNMGDDDKNKGVSGLLMDSSYLWETYLESLMIAYLPEYDIKSQFDIDYYKNTFYTKPNRLDFLLTERKTGRIFIIDAKCKHMEFRSKDVDNDDIHQVKCYSYYYLLKYGSRFRGTALVYPTRKNQTETEAENKKKFYDRMFGVINNQYNVNDQWFGILTLKDANELEIPESENTLDESEILDRNEQVFIERLKKFLEGNVELASTGTTPLQTMDDSI